MREMQKNGSIDELYLNLHMTTIAEEETIFVTMDEVCFFCLPIHVSTTW